MGKKRGSKCYKQPKRPYTRNSKYEKHMYIKGGVPHRKTTRFDMGEPGKDFPIRISLFTVQSANLLDNSIEAARQAANRQLLRSSGGKPKDYHFKIKSYPHHVVRINPIAMGAGADRYSTGMRQSYGKPTNTAARVTAGQEIMYVEVPPEKEEVARKALKKASHKLCVKTHIDKTRINLNGLSVEELKKKLR